ncbi:cupin-like domain-containing protein [Sphingorhabdus arenilitoris]|uniref:Cupin-like domain-containing protein n=1 Tax=Sphingorhabdus arenilitoris TaxID=1490041 RepID=A0ABV8RLT4_9SPHN
MTVPVEPIAEYHDVDRPLFEDGILNSGTPAIFRALVADWPATKAAIQSPENLSAYLRGLYNGAMIETFFAPGTQAGRHFYDPQMRGFNFERRNAPLPALLDKMIELTGQDDPMAIYAGSVPASHFVPQFAQENRMPLLDGRIEPRLWIGNRSRVAAHFDSDFNIACAISGKRRFTIFPPDQIGNLYIGPLEFNMAGPPASLVDFANPDFAKYPRFRQAMEAAIIVELEPGDALFLPPLWWHHVEADGSFNMLVNYWWSSSQFPLQMQALALSMLALRERPLAEKQAWRAYFDNYVFEEGATRAADHIPPHARGVLGAPSAQRTNSILGFIMNSLGKA